MNKKVDAITAVMTVGLLLVVISVAIIVVNQWGNIGAWWRILLVLVPTSILYLIAGLTGRAEEQSALHRGTMIIASVLVPVVLGTALVQLHVWPVANASLFAWCGLAGWGVFYLLEWLWRRESVALMSIMMALIGYMGLLINQKVADTEALWYLLVFSALVFVGGLVYRRWPLMSLDRLKIGSAASVILLPVATLTEMVNRVDNATIWFWVFVGISALYFILSFLILEDESDLWHQRLVSIKKMLFDLGAMGFVFLLPIASGMQLYDLGVKWEINAWIVALIGIVYWLVGKTLPETQNNLMMQLKSGLKEVGWLVAIVPLLTLGSVNWNYCWLALVVGLLASLFSLVEAVGMLVPLGLLGLVVGIVPMMSTDHGVFYPLFAIVLGLGLILSTIKIKIPLWNVIGAGVVVIAAINLSVGLFAGSLGWPIGLLVLGLAFLFLAFLLNRVTRWQKEEMVTYTPKVVVNQSINLPSTGGRGCCSILLILFVIYLALSFVGMLMSTFL